MTSTKYVIDGIDTTGTFDASLKDDLGGGEYTVGINGADRILRILNLKSDGIEFMLDNVYHKVKYISRTTREISLLIDGVPISLGMHAELDEIVFKNSGGVGGSGTSNAQISLQSQIPGKVVSIAVSEGDSVKKGDVVCTLESMKMQVAIKSHKDGEIKSIKVKESANVAKGDIIADIE